MADSYNGRWLMHWVIGALFAVTAFLAATSLAWVHQRLTTAEGTLAARGERITALEGRGALLEQKFHDIADDLAEIRKSQVEMVKLLREHERSGHRQP